LVWLILVALGLGFVAWETAKQLYRAAMDGYLLTGRRMSTRTYRDKNRALFRNNLISNIIMFPVVAAGAAIMLLGALRAAHLIH